MWEWTNCPPSIRFRTIRALSGGVTWNDCSSPRVLVCPCDTGQTPQIRWVMNQASRGSLPCRMISNPRNRVPELQASFTLPFSTSTSMRRCPSMRGIGSITTRFAMGSPSRLYRSVRWPYLLFLLVALPLRRLQHGVPHDGRAGDGRQPDADLVRRHVAVRELDVGELRVERGEVVRPAVLGAPDARGADLDAPGLLGVPARFRALRPRLGALAPHLVEAVPEGLLLRSELLHEAAAVEVGAARAVVVDLPAVEHLRATMGVELGHLPHGQHVDHRADEPLRVHRAARQVDDLPLHVEELVDALDPARVARRRRHAAVHRAGADGDDRLRVAAHLLRDVRHLPAADHPVARHGGDSPLDH